VRSPLFALLAFIALLVTPAVDAAAVAPPARAEIDALLHALEKSGCEFNRNGAWHPAADAKRHLARKLEYLEGRNAVQSAEQFIDLAGSTSSTSGQAYLVKCGNAAPVESRKWLASQLSVIRAAGRAPVPGAK